ncbi:MAG: hypothetical protein R2851_20860 [Caldilineaceae bacterium]
MQAAKHTCGFSLVLGYAIDPGMTPAKMGAGFPLRRGCACGWMFIACLPRPRNLFPEMRRSGRSGRRCGYCGIDHDLALLQRDQRRADRDCGVTITHPDQGQYDITFDFIVADRFIQVTPEWNTTGDGSIVTLSR